MGTGEPPACVAEGPGAGRAEAALAALTAELKWQRDEKADAQTGHDAHVHFTRGVTEARGQHRGDQHPLELSLSDPFHRGPQWSRAGRLFQVTGVTVLAPDRKLRGGGGTESPAEACPCRGPRTRSLACAFPAGLEHSLKFVHAGPGGP